MFTADAGTEGYGLAMFTCVLEMSTEDSLEVCRKASAEIENKNHHVWEPLYAIPFPAHGVKANRRQHNSHVAYGRKPSNAPKNN